MIKNPYHRAMKNPPQGTMKNPAPSRGSYRETAIYG